MVEHRILTDEEHDRRYDCTGAAARWTLRYSFRLYGPRSRLQMLQMKLASWV